VERYGYFMVAVVASAFTDHLVAWATLGAAVGTVTTLLFLAWQWTTDLRTQRRREVRAQAECVSAWLDSLLSEIPVATRRCLSLRCACQQGGNSRSGLCASVRDTGLGLILDAVVTTASGRSAVTCSRP